MKIMQATLKSILAGLKSRLAGSNYQYGTCPWAKTAATPGYPPPHMYIHAHRFTSLIFFSLLTARAPTTSSTCAPHSGNMFAGKRILGGIFLPNVSFSQHSPHRYNLTCTSGCEARNDTLSAPVGGASVWNGTVGLSFRKPAEPKNSMKPETPNTIVQILCERFPSAHGQISKKYFPSMLMPPWERGDTWECFYISYIYIGKIKNIPKPKYLSRIYKLWFPKIYRQNRQFSQVQRGVIIFCKAVQEIA